MMRLLAPLVGAVVVPSIMAARLASTAGPLEMPDDAAAESTPAASSTATASSRPADPPRPSPTAPWAFVTTNPCDGLPRPSIQPNHHRQNDGLWMDYEQIPRRPDRPASYKAYFYPVPKPDMVSGYDLDKPDGLQRRGRMPIVGHGGVDLVVARGTPIWMVPLEEQVGNAEVLYVGRLFGNTVITRHVVRECGHLHDYIVIFGHLETPAPDAARGRKLGAGDVVGYVGDSASPRLVHLHMEVRRMRDGVDAWGVVGWELKAREISIVTDPRNLLPLR